MNTKPRMLVQTMYYGALAETVNLFEELGAVVEVTRTGDPGVMLFQPDGMRERPDMSFQEWLRGHYTYIGAVVSNVGPGWTTLGELREIVDPDFRDDLDSCWVHYIRDGVK